MKTKKQPEYLLTQRVLEDYSQTQQKYRKAKILSRLNRSIHPQTERKIELSRRSDQIFTYKKTKGEKGNQRW